ncbi:MAG: AAA family ATPase, partial [Oscillospiraceae bacterium]|nr:AAA family ATPase [Oscillospiraceae bacterium]
MEANEINHFITGNELLNFIEAQTGVSSDRFKRRDFVEPLIDFCLDGNYTAKLGIVYGLRSTGKIVGMLQAAEELIRQEHKVAYARFNYEKTGMGDVNNELIKLTKDGISHFFMDEASYLSGFVNESAEWADMFVPRYRIKIIISGTDSFMLWTAQKTSLFHRYVLFAANWNSYPEYKRVIGKS